MRVLAPITGFTGLNGTGKTLSAVAAAAKARGLIVSTQPFEAEGCEVVAFSSMEQVVELRPNVLLLDEIQAVFSSRRWATVPADELSVISQLRKLGTATIWTGVDFRDVDPALRRITWEVIELSRVFGHGWHTSVWARTLYRSFRGDELIEGRLLGFGTVKSTLKGLSYDTTHIVSRAAAAPSKSKPARRAVA